MTLAAARPGETSVSRAVSLEVIRCPQCSGLLAEMPAAWRAHPVHLTERTAATGQGELRRCWRNSCRAWVEILITPDVAA